MSEGGRVVEGLDGVMTGMGHELRAPLHVIIGFSDLLLMELPGPLNDAQRTQLTAVRSAGRAMLWLTDNLVELARLERGEVVVERRASDLLPVIDEVRSSLQARAAEKGLALEVDASGPVSCSTDPRVLGRILVQLVANGIAFTETGSVTLRAREGELPGSVQVEVVDTGVGISQHDRTMLFQPLDRAAGEGANGRGGVALGLFISRRLADLLGAEITVESEVGRGTTCRVILPGSAER
jgi:signal transduction histidine kinase